MMPHVATYIQLDGPEQRLIDQLNNELPDWKFRLFNGKLYGVNDRRYLKCAIEFPERKYYPIFKEQVKDYLDGKLTGIKH